MIENWKKGLALYPGTCYQCGNRIEKDTPVAYGKDSENRTKRVHLECLSKEEESQRLIAAMPGNAPRTAANAPPGIESISSKAPVEESLELAVIALTEISKTLRAIEEKMRK